MKTKTARFGHRAAFRISTKLDWFVRQKNQKGAIIKNQGPITAQKGKDNSRLQNNKPSVCTNLHLFI